jgi:hypothetical protein
MVYYPTQLLIFGGGGGGGGGRYWFHVLCSTVKKNLQSVELLNLEAALIITDPIAKTLRNIQYQGNKLTKQINWMKRTLTQGLYVPIGAFQLPTIDLFMLKPSQKSDVGTLYRSVSQTF